ncbi:MAG: PAS domain-containing protein [Candidatus Thermoplasmatota archaeon]
MIGDLSKEIIDAVLETIPLEISVVDKDDKVIGWNKHDVRIFKRPVSVIGKDVRNCHPKKSLDKVEQILNEMKDNKRDKARFYIDLPVNPDGSKDKILIEYYALRDKKGRYLGCLEATQRIGELQMIKGEKRLLD